MTMAFAIVSLSAVNLGLVMRREREPAWSGPLFPHLGWIILGWILTWAAVELGMHQRLLYTTSPTGGQWLAVLGLVARHPGRGWDRQAHPAAAPGQCPGQGGRGIQN
jgi:Ca2+-transporting ATPase